MMTEDRVIVGAVLIKELAPKELPVYSPMYGLPRTDLFVFAGFDRYFNKVVGGTANSFDRAFNEGVKRHGTR